MAHFAGTDHIKMNATKSMIGHCLGAAGGLEAIAVIKAIETDYLHPTINLNNKEDEVDIDPCANEKVLLEVIMQLTSFRDTDASCVACVLCRFTTR